MATGVFDRSYHARPVQDHAPRRVGIGTDGVRQHRADGVPSRFRRAGWPMIPVEVLDGDVGHAPSSPMPAAFRAASTLPKASKRRRTSPPRRPPADVGVEQGRRRHQAPRRSPAPRPLMSAPDLGPSARDLRRGPGHAEASAGDDYDLAVRFPMRALYPSSNDRSRLVRSGYRLQPCSFRGTGGRRATRGRSAIVAGGASGLSVPPTCGGSSPQLQRRR